VVHPWFCCMASSVHLHAEGETTGRIAVAISEGEEWFGG
jgi:hypothetical protein